MSSYDLLIFGATRNTGLLIAKQAKQKGLSVAAMVRPESDISALQELGVFLVAGDAFAQKDCQHAFSQTQPRWGISVLGGKNAQGRRVDAQGNINIIHAAQTCITLSRFLLMTSMGCGDQYENTGEQVKKFLGEALLAKTQAEEVLQASPLPWIILRPGGLNHDEAVEKYHLSHQPDSNYNGYIPRADVAAATLQLLEEEKWLHQIITVQGDRKKKE